MGGRALDLFMCAERPVVSGVRCGGRGPTVGSVMGKIFGLVAAAAVGLSLLLAPPVQAGTVEFTTALGEGTLDVHDFTYEVSGCKNVYVDVVVSTVNSEVQWEAYVTARLEGTAITNSLTLSAVGSSLEFDSFLMCPWTDGAGTWLVTAEIYFYDDNTGQDAIADLSTSFEASKAATRTSITQIKPSRYTVNVKGKVQSSSSRFGVVGVSGLVEIQMRQGRRWVDVATGFADRRGNYNAIIFFTLPPKSVLRAVYSGDEVTERSVSKPRRL